MAKEVQGLTTAYFTDEIIQEILTGFDEDATLKSWFWTDMKSANGILADPHRSSGEHKNKRVVGLHSIIVKYTSPMKNSEDTIKIVIKSKPRGFEVLQMLVDISKSLGDEELKEVWKNHHLDIGLCNLDHRELQTVSIDEPSLCAIMPSIYWKYIDEDKDAFVFAMEYINTSDFYHIDSVNDVTAWQECDVLDALSGVAELHARYYGKTNEIPKTLTKWIDPFNKTSMTKLKPLWQCLLKHNHRNIPDIWNEEAYHILNKAIDHIEDIFSIIDSSPTTLIHNDFSVKNVCLRKTETLPEGKKKLCAYDWECATIGCPQRDIAEFLLFVLPPNTEVPIWRHYIESSFKYFQKAVKDSGDETIYNGLQLESFLKVFDMSVLDILINRLATYGPTHRCFNFKYLARVIQTSIGFVKSVKELYPFMN